MGKLRALGIAALVVALAALMMRVSCGDAATGSHPPDETVRETNVERAGAKPPPGDAPRPRARAQAATPGAADPADSGPGDVGAAADSAPDDGETRLLVRVVDEDGATVPGATVRWGRDDAAQETWREGRTDASGEVRVVLTAESTRLTASHARGIGASASTWALSLFAGSKPTTTIVLRKPVTISGVVVDLEGRAVRGAVVDTRLPWLRPAETGADGRFEFPPVPEMLPGATVGVTAPGHEAVASKIPRGGAQDPMRIVLRWTATIRMRIVDESGAPVSEALLMDADSMTIPTLVDGRCVLPRRMSPGSFVVAAGEACAANVSWTGPGPEIDLGDVRVAAVRPARVSLVWSDGAAADGASVVALTSVASNSPRSSSDLATGTAEIPLSSPPSSFDPATGTAEISLGSGTWPCVIRATRPPRDAGSLPRGTLELAVASIDLRAGDERRVTLVPAPILVVRAKDAEGAPVAFPPKTGVLIGEGRTFRLSTEGDRLAVPLPGEFPMRVTLEVPGHVPATLTIDAATGPRIERDVVLRPEKK